MDGFVAHGRPADGFPAASLDTLLLAAARARPRHPAIVTGRGVTTLAELADRVRRCAVVLRDLAGPGGVVAVTAVLDPAFAVGYYGALRAGTPVTPVNPLLPAAGLAHLLAESRTRVAVLSWSGYQRLRQVRGDLPDLRAVVLLDAPEPDTAPESLLTDLLAQAEPDADPGPAAEPDDVACLQFTSGTTGPPKAVLLTHRNISVNAWQVAEAHGLAPSTVTANDLPTYHPMHLNAAVAAGATQLLAGGPDVADSIELAGRGRASHYYSLPVRLARLAADPRLPGFRLPDLRVILSGGSVLAPDTARALAAHFGVPVVQGYGLAETAPLTHCDRAGRSRAGSVGPPVAGTACRIVDLDTGAVVPAGRVGEVQVRGPQVMRGYLGRPPGDGRTADGWLRTGDIGRCDADGWLFLVDRVKDVFKCDNFLVSPTEIERALAGQDAIGECCVFDLPEPLHGAVAAALVVPAGPDATADRVAAAVRATNDQLPYYEHIRRFGIVPEIPRSANGKIRRAELRGRTDLLTNRGNNDGGVGEQVHDLRLGR